MEEIWKDIKGYEGYYQVSNLGRVKSLDRDCVNNLSNQYSSYITTVFRKGKMLKLCVRGNYRSVQLFNNGKYKQVPVHRLVIETFIPNPENKAYVNHKDGNKLNNHVDNLEWVTAKENMQHAYKTGLMKPQDNLPERGKLSESWKAIPVYQMDSTGQIIKKWGCMKEPSIVLNINYNSISKCCRGLRNKAGGYIWRYADD